MKSKTNKINKTKYLLKSFNKRKIFCAASTHPNEEEIVSDIYLSLKKNMLLPLIINFFSASI